MKNKIISVLIILVGLGFAAYPWISNYLFENRVQSKVESYQDIVENIEDDEKDAMLAKAEEYNRNLSQSQVTLTDPFVEAEKNEEEALSYTNMLNMDPSGMMAYVEIPAIDVNLPVFHGTAASTLEIGVGHLEGSSLPVGGESTHAVLTGHTGLNKAKLFTDLTELKKGDLFFIHVAGRDLAYEVNDIDVVVPEDISKLLIVQGEDLTTLVTCTPYGKNTHRLLVTGKRVPYSEDAREEAIDNGGNTDSMWMRTYRKAVIIGIIVAIVLLSLITLFQKYRRRKR